MLQETELPFETTIGIDHRTEERATKSLPLILASIDTPLRVAAIRAGQNAEARLRELGLVPGRVISILQRQSDGPLVLKVGDARIAVGIGLCAKVFVTSANDAR